ESGLQSCRLRLCLCLAHCTLLWLLVSGYGTSAAQDQCLQETQHAVSEMRQADSVGRRILLRRIGPFTLPPLPLLTGGSAVPPIPHVHYSHNDVAGYARFCYWSGGGVETYFRRIPCSTICRRS